MRFLVIYDSETGNTNKVANAIFHALPGQDKDICRIGETHHDADLIFAGFWVCRGSASVKFLRYLSSLHHKKIALFGTCGIADQKKQAVEASAASAWISEDNEYLGSFLCQGRMEIRVRNCILAKKNEAGAAAVQFLLDAFDEAMLHPDSSDLDAAADFARRAAAKAANTKRAAVP